MPPETISMATMFVYNSRGERVAYSCRDIREEMQRGRERYRHGDAFIISRPRHTHEIDAASLTIETIETETIETVPMRVREFRHGRGRDVAFSLCGEFRDKADEQQYLNWYPELAPDWRPTPSPRRKTGALAKD